MNRAFGVIQIDKMYYISGLMDTDSAKLDGFITAIDDEGTEIWTRKYGGIEDDIGHAINRSHDGNIILSGYSKSFGKKNNSPWMVKLDSKGQEIWENSIGTNLEERIVSATVSQNGESTLLGYVFKKSNVDLLMVHVDTDGQLVWMKTFGSPKNEEAGQTFIKNGNNQIIYSGRTYKSDQTKGDLFIMIDSLKFY